jgi:hypothetical protein
MNHSLTFVVKTLEYMNPANECIDNLLTSCRIGYPAAMGYNMYEQLNVACISNTTQDLQRRTFLSLRWMVGLVLFLQLQLAFVQTASAEIYIYQGPNDERLISDLPPAANKDAYRLVTKRDTLSNAGISLQSGPLPAEVPDVSISS